MLIRYPRDISFLAFHDFLAHLTLHKISEFHLTFWCGNFVERHSFRIVSDETPETMRKLCLSTKFPHQKIRWNYSILPSVNYCSYILTFFNFPGFFFNFIIFISFVINYWLFEFCFNYFLDFLYLLTLFRNSFKIKYQLNTLHEKGDISFKC